MWRLRIVDSQDYTADCIDHRYLYYRKAGKNKAWLFVFDANFDRLDTTRNQRDAEAKKLLDILNANADT